jgi:hypothetical protein
MFSRLAWIFMSLEISYDFYNYFFFLIFVYLSSFLNLIAESKSFRTVSSVHGESGLYCLVLDLRGKALSFPHWTGDDSWELFIHGFLC